MVSNKALKNTMCRGSNPEPLDHWLHNRPLGQQTIHIYSRPNFTPCLEAAEYSHKCCTLSHSRSYNCSHSHSPSTRDRPRIEGPVIPLCLPAGNHCCSDSLCSSVSQARALRRQLSAHNQQLQLLVDSQQHNLGHSQQQHLGHLPIP